jgi:Uncharacterized protein conserved in bacteria
MRTLFLTLLLASTCQITFAQDTIVKKLYYPSGKLRAEMSYVGNTPNGFFREYTEQGQIRVEEYYLNGRMDSVRREYYDGGQLNRNFVFVKDCAMALLTSFMSRAKFSRRLLTAVTRFFPPSSITSIIRMGGCVRKHRSMPMDGFMA